MVIFLREFSSLMVIIVSLITIHTANLLSPISASASEIKTTIFRQSFWVENNEVFNDFKVEEFQTIYSGSTFQFAPNNEASKTVTNCSVFHQQMSVPEEKEEDEEEDEDDEDQTNFRLDIDFTMRYESIYHEVEDYPRMFQNWTNQNLETIRYKLNVLNLDVSDLGKALRIVVSTTAPAPSVPAVPVVRN
ncbi:hypothetical protein FRACYDRAFT_250008 [Fragilariopsis cylindrus CCMP1102]|uniref:Uncharacterized protein n=1 Tax=Fragilariopsis cylindrus CCMP1102 TaxID=635003 RepID=A0A1E7EQI9_9STRA|nr:hypothetical protein FRACYDRAFT_250008 [Fragilariopsis cylindrus CCMP1102]|eukprot:OEU08221.1 hypothetical protein FRACYDRAFT_250008 [Fragilariopsis cylindrus CCMP1102]